jgi:hypothetical protein
VRFGRRERKGEKRLLPPRRAEVTILVGVLDQRGFLVLCHGRQGGRGAQARPQRRAIFGVVARAARVGARAGAERGDRKRLQRMLDDESGADRRRRRVR